MKIMKRVELNNPLEGSYKDPSGLVYSSGKKIYRTVNRNYKSNYDLLISSGLYEELVDKNYLVSYTSVNNIKKLLEIYKVIRPQYIPFISYPYEWCFSQLKDAALLTLEINRRSLLKGMILKDASTYNVQFNKGKPLFIDSLSFEKYKEGEPWIAYQQFCRHFLAPLLLAAYCDFRLIHLLKTYIDGIPLDLTSKILPYKTHFNFSILSHIHFHAKAENYFESKFKGRSKYFLPKNSLLAINDNLKELITSLELKIKSTEWSDYYSDNSYDSRSLQTKKRLIEKFMKSIKTKKIIWDLGSNIGFFSKNLNLEKSLFIDIDNDYLAIEENYLDTKKKGISNVLPLNIDITNPSPGIGWTNSERMTLVERGPCDVVLALALVHHLVFSYNLSFANISDFFKRITKWCIVEFVPKNDLQIKRMLLNKKDIYTDYDQINFEKVFSKNFTIMEKVSINSLGRLLYLMKKK